MIRSEPTIIVKRLLIERDSSAVYDERFHAGVNIIRGENSSGKSTILNFLFYALGGDLTDWSEVAKLCTTVLIEVELNGHTATLSREISVERGRPMDVFGGSIDLAKKAPREAWIRYPYSRSQSKESFSQAIFRLLGIPEVANDATGNITLHQILRLLYADQLSPVENLFKFDSLFDTAILRETVGRLLCGAYDSSLYQNELDVRRIQRDFDTVSGELRSLFSVVGHSGDALTLDWIAGQRSVLQEQYEALQSTIEEAEKRVFSSGIDDSLTLRDQQLAYGEVQRLQESLSSAQQERDALALDIEDSEAFIAGLKNKIIALSDSKVVSAHFGDIYFQSCPACHAPLEDGLGAPKHACHLCKTPFDAERSRGRIVALINDSSLQLKQSEALQSRRYGRMETLNQNVKNIEAQWEASSRKLHAVQRLPSSEARNELRSLHQRSGYLERQMENLEERAQVVEQVNQLSKKKEYLNSELGRLRAMNEALRQSQERRLSDAHVAIENAIRDLLRHDLRRQDSFENPRDIQFDFGGNKISVDGQTYFSASSRVILKSSFFLGFLAAATVVPAFRHPRFCIIDTIEDKGMEPQRSHNFQLQIDRISKESKVEHQIIFATAMIAPDLDDEAHTVGKFSTRDDPTISIQL